MRNVAGQSSTALIDSAFEPAPQQFTAPCSKWSGVRLPDDVLRDILQWSPDISSLTQVNRSLYRVSTSTSFRVRWLLRNCERADAGQDILVAAFKRYARVMTTEVISCMLGVGPPVSRYGIQQSYLRGSARFALMQYAIKEYESMYSKYGAQAAGTDDAILLYAAAQAGDLIWVKKFIERYKLRDIPTITTAFEEAYDIWIEDAIFIVDDNLNQRLLEVWRYLAQYLDVWEILLAAFHTHKGILPDGIMHNFLVPRCDWSGEEGRLKLSKGISQVLEAGATIQQGDCHDEAFTFMINRGAEVGPQEFLDLITVCHPNATVHAITEASETCGNMEEALHHAYRLRKWPVFSAIAGSRNSLGFPEHQCVVEILQQCGVEFLQAAQPSCASEHCSLYTDFLRDWLKCWKAASHKHEERQALAAGLETILNSGAIVDTEILVIGLEQDDNSPMDIFGHLCRRALTQKKIQCGCDIDELALRRVADGSRYIEKSLMVIAFLDCWRDCSSDLHSPLAFAFCYRAFNQRYQKAYMQNKGAFACKRADMAVKIGGVFLKETRWLIDYNEACIARLGTAMNSGDARIWFIRFMCVMLNISEEEYYDAVQYLVLAQKYF